MRLQNGADFPDSGYATDDHDQGKIAHWEPFIEAYIQRLRQTYDAPYDSPAAQAEMAFLMGLTAHGITDSTFDPLLYERIAQIDPCSESQLDTAMDIFLVSKLPRFYVPEFDYDAQAISKVFAAIPHDVTPEEVDTAMTLGRAGVAAVTTLLFESSDALSLDYPFGSSRFLDFRTPGGYPFGAGVVLGYHESLLRRIDGDTSADPVLVGVYPMWTHRSRHSTAAGPMDGFC